MREAERIRPAEPLSPPTAIPLPEAGEGFVIEEVEMHGFMRYLDKAPPIRFPGQFTVITGPTGSGKTSILDAITFALYKRTTRTDPPANAKIEDLCRPGGHVRVAFRQRGNRYEVRRGFQTNGHSYLELAQDGRTIAGTIPEKEHAIQDVIGLDYEGFLNSTFVRQEEMKGLGASSGSARLAVFQKLFRLETFEKAAKKAGDQLSTVELEVKGKEQEILTRRERIDRLPALREELAALETAVADLRAQESQRAAKIKEMQDSLRGLEAKHDEYTRTENTAKNKLARLQDITSKVEALEKAGAKALKLRETIATLEQETQGVEALVEEAERLRDVSQRHQIITQQREGLTREWEGHQEEHERRLKQLSDALFAEEARIGKLSTDVSGDEAFGLLRTEGRLEERVARIEKELAWLADRKDLVSELDAERSASEQELVAVKDRTGRISEDSFVLSEIERHITDLKRQIKEEDAAHEDRQREMRDKFGEVDRKIAEVAFSDEARARLKELRVSLPAAEAKRKDLQARRKELEALGDPTARLAELKEEQAGLAAELEAIAKDLDALKKDEEAFVTAKDAVDAEKKALDELRYTLGTKEGERKRLAAQIEETEAEGAKIDEASKALYDLTAHAEVLGILKNEVFHKKGVVMYAINQLLPALQIEASRILADLTDGRFSQLRLETYEEPRGHGIKILVLGVDGEWHDVGEFSGGEKTQINAALRFAIAKELASMPQVGRTYGRMKTLFLDEADLGSLDTEVSRDLFVQKLFDIGAFFDKVILITHLTEVADRFPGRIRVEMTEQQVSRAEVLA